MFGWMSWLRFYKPRLLASAVMALLLLLASPAGALNIVLDFNAEDTDSPTFDSTGALLVPIMQAAAAYWEDIIHDTGTLDIEYYYDDLSGSTLATHNNQGTSDGKPTEAKIRFDTQKDGVERNWFFDPTPTNHSEYDLQQTLFRDLDSGDQSDWFSGSPPDLLEVGYRGGLSETAPAAAIDAYDLLSSAIHEIGHAVGLTSNVSSGEYADGDYDISPDLVGGAVMAIKGDSHLDSRISLMCSGCGNEELRRMPSATDIFAVATGSDWTSIDLPRQDFMTGSDWNTDSNWEGNQVPGSADDAWVRHGDNVNLSSNGRVENLTVAEDSYVFTGSHRLAVDDELIIGDDAGTVGGVSVMDAVGELDAESITVRDNGYISLLNGGLVDAEIISLETGGNLNAAGTVDVSSKLNNNGTITASDGTLTLTTSNTGGVFNLDGFLSYGGMLGAFTEPGKVNATLGDIVVDGELTDGFSGTMTVSSTRTITFQDDWELSSFSLSTFSTGFLNLTEGTVAGSGKMTAKGVINVLPDTGTSISYINSPIDFVSTVSVNVESGSELETNGTATVEGGTYNINDDGLLDFNGMLSIGSATINDVGAAGTADVRFDGVTTYTGGTIDTTVPLMQYADATVNGATVINGTVVNLDGAGSTIVTLNEELVINADKLDSSSNKFDGMLNINNPGHLTVNTPDGSWTMAGTMNLDQNGQSNTYLVRGDDVNISGQVTVTGATAMKAAAHISGTVTLGDAGDLLQLDGVGNTLTGGEIAGPGTLVTGGKDLTGYGTISTDIQFGGFAANLFASGGVLSVSGEILEVVHIGTASSSGTLDMVNAWNTDTADELRLNGGEVTGSSITNDGTTIGHGLVTSSSFVNNSILTADGGTLVMDTDSYPDLDGTTETGIVNALQGSIEVLPSNTSRFHFDGTLNVGAGHTFRSDARGLTNSGVVNLTNATISTATLRHQDQLNVFSGGTSRLESPTIEFRSGSTSAVDDDLEVMGDTDIFSGALLTGSGRLVVPAGSLLTLLDGAAVEIEIENNGQMSVGSSPGAATIEALTQTGDGQLGIELAGTVLGIGYDHLDVINTATLAGTLDVNLIDGFYPAQGDKFSILTAGMRNGELDAIDGIQIAADLTLAPLYDYEDLIGLVLIAALPGDANFDGIVDVADLGIVGANFNAADMQWDTGDFNLDGMTDVADLGILGANWSNGGSLSSAQGLEAAGLTALVPEPATLSLFLMSVLMVGHRWR